MANRPTRSRLIRHNRRRFIGSGEEWRIANQVFLFANLTRIANSVAVFTIRYSPISPREKHIHRGKNMPQIRRFAFAALALACTGAIPASAALITHKDLSLDVAKTIAEAAVAACAAKTYAVSAVVVDRDGETIVAMRGDEAAPHTMENARRKAYTAMTFRQPTAEYAKKLQDPTSVAHQQVTLPNVIAIPGGQPIKIGNQVVGGVGVSGSPGVDDDCVNAGLDKVKDQLQ
jgi:uncharacterized protein GlcG (DUF336 family)